jgi:hypothetical protein
MPLGRKPIFSVENGLDSMIKVDNAPLSPTNRLKTPTGYACKRTNEDDLAEGFGSSSLINTVRLQVEQIQLVANIAQVVIAVHLLKCL